jgi:hypothetical protein
MPKYCALFSHLLHIYTDYSCFIIAARVLMCIRYRPSSAEKVCENDVVLHHGSARVGKKF